MKTEGCSSISANGRTFTSIVLDENAPHMHIGSVIIDGTSYKFCGFPTGKLNVICVEGSVNLDGKEITFK